MGIYKYFVQGYPAYALNLFQTYAIKVIIDYKNNVVSYNCNGNKVILRDDSLPIWRYYGLATRFSTIGTNATSVIPLEYEFTTIKKSRNEMRGIQKEVPFVFPRFDCAHYQELIKNYKDVDAMYLLGMNYYEGAGGVRKDYCQAFKWFKKAAMDEHVFAQYYLGLCYLYGRGTEQNDSSAWKWISRSADYFYDKAQVLAAQCVIDKVKKTTELNRARLLQEFLGPAFFQGNANACFLQSYCALYDVGKNKLRYLERFQGRSPARSSQSLLLFGKTFRGK